MCGTKTSLYSHHKIGKKSWCQAALNFFWDYLVFTAYSHVMTLHWRHNGATASKITSLTIVYSTVYSGIDQRKHQSSASLAFVRGIHRFPVNSPHKWPVTRKILPFDDVIMMIYWSMMRSWQGNASRITTVNSLYCERGTKRAHLVWKNCGIKTVLD